MAATKRTFLRAQLLEKELTDIGSNRALTEAESLLLEDAIRDQGRFHGTRKRQKLHLVIG